MTSAKSNPILKNDIFLSYAWRDNIILPTESQLWIDSFYDCLKKLLETKVGRDIYIWRDLSSLHGSNQLTNEIYEALRNSKTLIAIVSPSYIKSRWCRDEIDIFYQAIREVISAKNSQQYNAFGRIFRVGYYPLNTSARNRVPQPIQGLYEYIFYKKGIKDGESETLRAELDFKEYLDQLYSLTYDLKKTLEALEGVQCSSSKTIYLAETSEYLKLEREKLEKELLDSGYTVLPDKRYESPFSLLNPERAIRESLQDSKLSVHIVGHEPTIDSGVNYSLSSEIVLQYKIAKEENILRIVWKPLKAKLHENIQNDIIQSLQDPSDFLKNSVENDVKHYIHDRLNQIQISKEETISHIKTLQNPSDIQSSFTEKLSQQSINSNAIIKVYLIYNASDSMDTIMQIENSILNKNPAIDILKPRFEGSPREIRKHHEQNLISCEQVIIYMEGENNQWLNAQVRDLLKIKPKRIRENDVKLVYKVIRTVDEIENIFF